MGVDPAHYFRIEARELLASLMQGALALEESADDPAAVVRLLRLAHTLKGAARVVGEEEVATLAHAAEEVLALARDRGGPFPAEGVRELLRGIDAMSARVAAMEPPRPAAGAPVPAAPVPAPAAAPAAGATVRVELREMDALLEGIGEIGAQVAALQGPVDEIARARDAIGALEGLLRARPVRFEDGTPAMPRIRGILDAADDALTRCRDALDERRGRSEAELSLLRERARGLRLLPVGVLLPALERAVRDAARELGKRATFTSTGAEVRLDSPVHELLRDALLQLARNAVAHGIEAPDARAAAGKPPVGTVRLDVARTEGNVVLTLSDDGAGIDVEAVARVAAARGRLSPGETLTLDRAVALLSEGRLSTTGTADLTSGRGVGMNLVAWAVRQAKGKLAIRTDRGRGTVVEIRVPAMLLAMTALRVEVGGSACWIPAESVLRTDRIGPEELAWEDGRAAFLDHRGPVPLVSLRALLGIGELPLDGERFPVVLVEDVGRRAAVAVDHLVGLRAIVAQPLRPGLADTGPVAWTTLDPEGIPELVVRPAALVEAPAVRARESAAPAARPLLVVDDSLTTRILEQSILETAGYEVDLAVSGEEGLVLAKRRAYALVLVDVEMGGIDGFAFVEALHADPARANTPCILVTSRASEDDRRRGREVGAAGYVVKGEFRQEEFLSLVRRLVEQA